MADHINHDPLYNAVDRDDFLSMIEVNRYADRADAFDSIISATVDHFWDPTDPRYIDFDADPFDLDTQMLLPEEMTVTAIASAWGFSNFGALAGRYRARFGETPSQTRRRKSG